MLRPKNRIDARALSLAILAAGLLVSPALAQTATPAPATAAAPTAAEPSAVDDEDNATDPEEQVLVRAWERQPAPPDGKWLVDENGREYYVRKIQRPREGGYLRLSENKVRMPGGVTLRLEKEDADFFYARVYRVDNFESSARSKKVEPPAEALAAKEAEYQVTTTESSRILFVTVGAGLPERGQWRNGFELVDVDGDGKLDVAHGGVRRTLNGQPSIFLGLGNGNFQRWEAARFPAGPYDYGDIAVGDFEGDGDQDLAFAIHLRGVLALMSDGKGAFQTAAEGLDFEAGPLETGKVGRFSSRAILALDFDGDGDDEILALAEGPMGSFAAQKGSSSRFQQSYGIGLYDFKPDKGWTAIRGGKTHPELFGDSVAQGDFDGDGRIDFAVGSNSRGNRGLVHRQTSDGTWAYEWLEALRDRSYPRVIAVADFDQDGRDDLAVGYQSVELGVWRTGVDVLLARPEQKWERHTVYVEPERTGFFALATGDLDHDGHADLAAGTGDGRVFAFLGDGRGGFSREETDDLDAEPTCRVYHLEIGDLDGDGRGDLVAAFAGEQCPGGGRLSAWASRKPRG